MGSDNGDGRCALWWVQVIPHHGDASLVCYMHRDEDKRFDVLDLDPCDPTPSYISQHTWARSDP